MHTIKHSSKKKKKKKKLQLTIEAKLKKTPFKVVAHILKISNNFHLKKED